MARNKLGQFTSINHITQAINKRLQAIATDEQIKIKALVRDELEQTLRSEIYASRTPATEKGLEVKEYNETHKHQKSRPYHHTGKLESSIYAIIDGDTVKAMVQDKQYDNGRSTTEVYDYLKFGTTDTPKNDVYDYANGNQFSKYISQEPHNFEARTREHMEIFLRDLETDIEQNGTKHINPKYLKKLRKSDM